MAMIRLTHKNQDIPSSEVSLTLAWDQRIKSRLRVKLDDGREAGIFLPRGTILRGGDHLNSEDGVCIQVVAANEHLSVVKTDDALLLAKICYHLGNRHVSLAIEEGRASYLHDHVLDEMVIGLGAVIEAEHGPFEPEHGAYGGGHHSHG